MEVSFLDLREREIVNVYDGKKLGRIIDVVFNNTRARFTVSYHCALNWI